MLFRSYFLPSELLTYDVSADATDSYVYPHGVWQRFFSLWSLYPPSCFPFCSTVQWFSVGSANLLLPAANGCFADKRAVVVTSLYHHWIALRTHANCTAIVATAVTLLAVTNKPSTPTTTHVPARRNGVNVLLSSSSLLLFLAVKKCLDIVGNGWERRTRKRRGGWCVQSAKWRTTHKTGLKGTLTTAVWLGKCRGIRKYEEPNSYLFSRPL